MSENRNSGEGDIGNHPATSNKIVSNIVALGSGEVLSRCVAFVAVAYLARTLGPAGFGVLGFALAICGYMSLAVDTGFGDVGVREVARRPYKACSLAAGATLVRMMMAGAAFAVICIVAGLLDKPPTVRWVLLLTGLSFFSLALDTSWVHKGLEHNRRVGIALILRQVFYVGFVLLAIHGPQDVLRVPVIQFICEAGAAIWLSASLIRIGAPKFDVRSGFEILVGSRFVTFSRLFRTIIFTTDVVLIGMFLGERAVGLYVAPYRFCFLLLAVSASIHISYRPALARVLKQDKEQLGAIVARSLALASAVGVPMIAGSMVTAAPLLRFLYGQEYIEGAAAFRLLILSIGIFFVNGTIHNLFVVCDGMKIEMCIIACAAVLNIGLNCVLIPWHGLLGAATATLIAMSLILFLGMLAAYKMGLPISLRPVARPILASITMAAVVLALGSGQHLTVYIVVGVFVYALALLLLRGIPEDVKPITWKWVPSLVAKRNRHRSKPTAKH